MCERSHMWRYPDGHPDRGVFCNRTLNFRSIQAIGFDMDYTLIHYDTAVWERRAYEATRDRLDALGWPVANLQFDGGLVSLGLILDLDLGNIVKANRFGYVKKAYHGTTALSFEQQRTTYGRTFIDLADSRWVFLNTLFGISEGCMYAQAVNLLDEQKIKGVMGYRKLYEQIRSCLDEAHMEGSLKREIAANPAEYVIQDPDLALSLLDLKHAGKKLLLITNSEWQYTRSMMAWTIDKHLPDFMRWTDLFDLMIVSAGKPDFFDTRKPMFRVIDDEGHLEPINSIVENGIYLGGNAPMVENFLGVPGDEILYVGDHIFADVKVSKSRLQWRTALVVRELESEISAAEGFRPKQQRLAQLMEDKEELEHRFSRLRIQLQRIEKGYGPRPDARNPDHLKKEIQALRAELVNLDSQIAPLAKEASELTNRRWGPLMRAGNDKSHLARQIERYADIYTSRVSNLIHYTPFVYIRAPRGSLPHDINQPFDDPSHLASGRVSSLGD